MGIRYVACDHLPRPCLNRTKPPVAMMLIHSQKPGSVLRSLEWAIRKNSTTDFLNRKLVWVTGVALLGLLFWFLVEPVAGSVTNYECSTSLHSLTAKSGFVILAENVKVLNDPINIERDRAIYKGTGSGIVNNRSKSRSPLVSTESQHVSRRSLILRNFHGFYCPLSIRSKNRVSPDVNAIGWGFSAVDNVNIGANMNAPRIRACRWIRHIERAGPQISPLLLFERVLRSNQRVACDPRSIVCSGGALLSSVGSNPSGLALIPHKTIVYPRSNYKAERKNCEPFGNPKLALFILFVAFILLSCLALKYFGRAFQKDGLALAGNLALGIFFWCVGQFIVYLCAVIIGGRQ
jgi:hypothetical protein